MIGRDKYLTQLVDKIGNGMIKIISGMRRSGKSYLLNAIFYQYLRNERKVDDSRIIKFAFDKNNDLKKIGEDFLSLKKEKRKVDPYKFSAFIDRKTTEPGHYFLLLDEVQELDSFEYVLNSYAGEDRFDVYVTGSNAKFLVRDIITEFRGRVDKIHVLPLSFSECWNYYADDKKEALERYMRYGGLPTAVLALTEEEKISYIKTQIEETYLTDIVDRYGVRNKIELEELFNVLASGISGLVNPKKLANTFRSAHNDSLTEATIAQYIKHFEDSFLVDIANKHDVKGKKYISTPYKVYFEDLGVRNARINFRQTKPNHIMENVIYNELRYRGFTVDVGDVKIRETVKGDNGKNQRKQYSTEVDFVANYGGKRYYIQSAYRINDVEKLRQEVRPLRNIGDSFKKIVVVSDYIVPRYDDSGIFYIGLLDFLSDPHSLEKQLCFCSKLPFLNALLAIKRDFSSFSRYSMFIHTLRGHIDGKPG